MAEKKEVTAAEETEKKTAPAKKAPAEKPAAKAEGEKKPAAKKTAAPKAESEKKPAAPKAEKAAAPKTEKTAKPKAEPERKAAENPKADPEKKTAAPKTTVKTVTVGVDKKKKGLAPKKGEVKILLVRSTSGRTANQLATVHSLGLRKIGDVTIQPDNAATRGKLAKISHMVEVTEA